MHFYEQFSWNELPTIALLCLRISAQNDSSGLSHRAAYSQLSSKLLYLCLHISAPVMIEHSALYREQRHPSSHGADVTAVPKQYHVTRRQDELLLSIWRQQSIVAYKLPNRGKVCRLCLCEYIFACVHL